MHTFFWLLVGLGAGLTLIVYTEQIKSFTGPMDFAEKYFGMGGTYNFLKLFGVFIIIFTILWATGGLAGCVPKGLVTDAQLQ